MKSFFLSIICLSFFSFAQAQVLFGDPDSLKAVLANTREDSTKSLICAEIAYRYAYQTVDSGIRYAQKAIALAKQIDFDNGEAAGLASYGWNLWAVGDYDKAIEAGLKSLKIQKGLGDKVRLVAIYSELAVFYRDVDDFDQALKYGVLAKDLYASLDYQDRMTESFLQLGTIYLFNNQLDSAAYYIHKEYDFEKAYNDVGAYVYNMMGYLETAKKNYPAALKYYRASLESGAGLNNFFDVVNTYTYLSLLYKETGQIDSSNWYAKEVLSKSKYYSFRRGARDVLGILAQNYKILHQNDSALKYLELRITLNDSLFNKEKARAIQALSFNEEMQQKELEANRKQYQSQVRLYAVFGVATLFLIIGIILYRNNRVRLKANVLLKTQKEKLESTLKTLESTQAQLVQSEKMASLGELTAGIAHEIQNPLNFVNNFSEVNRELIGELKTELDKGNMEEVKMLADDIESNEEKILFHGKRADSIVKGMLQHSRSSTGVRELTDVNALADEYLRLSYQGLRAKDKSFQAGIKADLGETIGSVLMIPQDFGRVLLNLFNNAFYAVTEKKKELKEDYEPTVSLTTKKSNGNILISVKDNGNGIPKKIIEKIFQPFFTTKPTGQGTGLGLSLSYDIVKAHGGEIKVESKEGEGSEFIVQIPVN